MVCHILVAAIKPVSPRGDLTCTCVTQGCLLPTILTTFYAMLDSYSDIRTSYSYLDVIKIHLFLFVACVRFVVGILLLDNILFV